MYIRNNMFKMFEGQNAKIFDNTHLRWFIIRKRIGKRKKKTLFFICKFLIEENG